MPNDPFGSDAGTAIVADKEDSDNSSGNDGLAPQPTDNAGFASKVVGGFSFPQGFGNSFGYDSGGIVGDKSDGEKDEDPDTMTAGENSDSGDTTLDTTSYSQDTDSTPRTSISNERNVPKPNVEPEKEKENSEGDIEVDNEEDTQIQLNNNEPPRGGSEMLVVQALSEDPNMIRARNSSYSVVYDGLTGDTNLSIRPEDFLPSIAKLSKVDKLSAEGLSQHRPEIVAMTQFHSMFKVADSTDNISNEFLNIVADPANLKSLPASRLMEIQTYVRNLTSKNTRDILQIFNNRYDTGTRNISDLGEFFKNIVSLNNKTKFLDNVKYDILQDDYDITEVVQEAVRSGNDTNMSVLISENKENTYVRMIIRYLIINNLARRFFEILNIINSYNENFLLDFYEDVIIGAQIDDSDIKQVFDNRNLSMNLSDHSLRGIIRPDLPNSVNLIRIIKALHASCMGYVNFVSERIFNDDEPAAFYNLALGSKSSAFLKKGRMMMYEDILGPYRPSNNHNGSSDGQTTDNRDLHLDLGIQLDHSDNCDILVTLLYDMKNTAREHVGINSHNKLLKEHIASSGIKNANPFLGEKYTEIADVLDFLDSNSFGGFPNMSPGTGGVTAALDNPIYPNTHAGKLIYKESESNPGKIVLLIDGQNGIVSAEAETSDLITASDEYFNVENITADNFTEANSIVRENVEAIIEDIKKNYGLININQNASYPKNYIENFFDKLAAQLEKIKSPSTADKATLLQAVLLTRAGENFDFCFDLFVASVGLFHDKNFPNSSKSVYLQEGLTSETGNVEPTAPIKNFGVVPSLEAAGIGKEVIKNSKFSDAYTNSNGILYHSPFDKVFVHYYRYLMPASYMTVGEGNNSPSDWYQAYVESAYKNNKVNTPRVYDGDKTEYLWNNQDGKTHVSIGNDDFTELTKPANATHHNAFCKHENFNATFKKMIKKQGSDNQMIMLPFSHDKEFLIEIDSNVKTANISIDELNNIVTVNGFKSSNLTRMYKLFKIMCSLFRNAFSFSIQADGLNEESDNHTNNNKRAVRIYYNKSMIEGAIDGLRGGKDENEDYFDEAMYDNEDDSMYKHAYNKTLNSYRSYILGKIKKCDDRSIILSAAISKYSNYYRTNLEGYMTAFSGDSSEALISNYLDYIGDARSIFNFYNQDQFALASITHKRLMFPSLNNYFLPNGKDITSNQLKCLYKFLSCKPNESNYRNSSFIATEEESFNQRQKKLIFHVGIPNGLVQSMRNDALDAIGFDQLSFEQQTSALGKSKNSKIIKIQLFKKDLLNPNYDVMVQEYLFDMSKFFIDGLDHEEISNTHYSFAANNVGYNNFINNHFMYQVNGNLSTSKLKVSKINAVNDINDSETNLTTGQKKELLGNHLNDYYLKLYCKTMLGIDYDEDIYQFSDVKNQTLRRGPDPGLGQSTYNSAFLTPLQQVIQLGQNNPAYLKERARIASEGERSVFFSGRKYFERTVNPKLFDRVFSIFVNLHDLDSISVDQVSIDQFYCSITLTDYQLDFSDSKSGVDLEKIKDAFEEKHGIHAGMPGSKRSRI